MYLFQSATPANSATLPTEETNPPRTVRQAIMVAHLHQRHVELRSTKLGFHENWE